MNRVTINDPLDIVYPLDKELFEDVNIVYHGTSSCFADNIAKNGWKINGHPYEIQDVVKVCNVFSAIDFSGERDKSQRIIDHYFKIRFL